MPHSVGSLASDRSLVRMTQSAEWQPQMQPDFRASRDACSVQDIPPSFRSGAAKYFNDEPNEVDLAWKLSTLQAPSQLPYHAMTDFFYRATRTYGINVDVKAGPKIYRTCVLRENQRNISDSKYQT